MKIYRRARTYNAEASADLSSKLMSCTTTRGSPGGTAATFSTVKLRLGTGSGKGAFRRVAWREVVRAGRQLCRAETKDFQLATASSTGASARDTENRARDDHTCARLLVGMTR